MNRSVSFSAAFFFLLVSILFSGCVSEVEDASGPVGEDDRTFVSKAPEGGSSSDEMIPEAPSDDRSDMDGTGKKAPAEPERLEDSVESGLREKDYGDEELLFALESEAMPAPGGMEEGSRGGSFDGTPAASGLKAGYADDNRQYGYFLRFLDEFGSQVPHLPLEVGERIRFEVTDRDGKPLSGAVVLITAEGFSEEGTTMADGSYQFYPPDEIDTFSVEALSADRDLRFRTEIERDGPRTVAFPLDMNRIPPNPLPLDVVFIMDTTGSMGEEIQRLKSTIEIIHLNLSALSPQTRVRFGMVLYRDVEDDYRTEIIPLTADLRLFQRYLNDVEAGGGGDTPEDLQAALDDAMHQISWDEAAIKLGYIITDAPPHLDYGQDFSYTDAAREAKQRGIKFFGIGTGGLNLLGEVVLRQIAQYTSGRYIFLTYGEEGESSGGSPGSVSHHTGANWSADKLENIIIRFTREELAYQSDTPLEQPDSWFEANQIPGESTEETLGILFSQALDQLLDFTTLGISREDALAVLPFQGDGAAAEYFTENFIMAVSRSERVTLAERKDISQILEEQALQNSGLTDEEQVTAIGNLLNAGVLISGNLYIRDGNYELFLKMLRTETGEVLSVTRAVIEKNLGI